MIPLEQTSLYGILVRRLKGPLLQWASSAAPGPTPYLRHRDIMSGMWALDGRYEHYLNCIIDHFVAAGFCDFFLDVGANIGMTAIQNADKFTHTYCFEPNELVFNILSTNVQLSTDSARVSLHNVGLGEQVGDFDLFIPRHNFGGAFVREGNDYTDETLASKDGLGQFNPDDYLVKKVRIEDAAYFREHVACKLGEAERGLVKIDVEGHELNVLRVMSECLGKRSFVAVLENLGGLQVGALRELLQAGESSRVVKFYRMRSNLDGAGSVASKIVKAIVERRVSSLESVEDGTFVDRGDIVMEVTT